MGGDRAPGADGGPAGGGTGVEAQLRAATDRLTRAERQLASHLLAAFPVAGLASITALARAAGVSSPTVVRLVQKLGYRGYPDFQAALRAEVGEMLVTPLAKHDRWAGQAPDAHVLNRFAEAVARNLQATLGGVDHAGFDAAAALLADPGRGIFVVGGRITHALADYAATHLGMMRPRVRLLDDRSSTWPPALLDMAAGDVLVVFDIRRYENAVLHLAEAAAERGVEVILLTDRWLSPAARVARHRFAAHVEAPSPWDSTVAILVLVETLLAGVADHGWEATRARMQGLEDIYARTRLFRRY
ncbi:MAG: MurR/RpiR family transcriptional regulator [Rhodobacteraceae bacterium]|nr:MurR/RpiR family transcriptional regulator [Paracoccaceae bacterium]